MAIFLYFYLWTTLCNCEIKFSSVWNFAFQRCSETEKVWEPLLYDNITGLCSNLAKKETLLTELLVPRLKGRRTTTKIKFFLLSHCYSFVDFRCVNFKLVLCVLYGYANTPLIQNSIYNKIDVFYHPAIHICIKHTDNNLYVRKKSAN